MKICSWNVNSLLTKKWDLEKYLWSKDIDVCMLQETRLKPNYIINISGYKIIRKDKQEGIHGLAIIIKNDYLVTDVDMSNLDKYGVDIQSIKFVLGNEETQLINLYAHHGFVHKDLWKEIFYHMERHPNTILSGDLNAQHTNWGSQISNARGNKIIQELKKYNLQILNTGKPTRITKPNINLSVTDLVISHANQSNSWKWDVEPDSMGSDHKVMIISKQPGNGSITSSHKRWHIKETHWNEYEQEVGKLFNNCKMHSKNHPIQYENMHNCITTAADNVFQKIKNIKYNKRHAWWNEKCQEAINKRKSALKHYYRKKTMEAYNNYLECLKKCREVINNEKRTAWKDLCQQASTTNSTKTVSAWKLLKILNNGTNLNETKFLNTTLYPQVAEDIITSITIQKQAQSYINLANEQDLKPFTMEELTKVLDSKTKDTTPGHDGITYQMVKKLPINIKENLLQIYNESYRTGTPHPSWKKFKILLIKKPGRKDYDKKSYRPITLIPVIPKILNYMVKQRMENLIEKNKILMEEQHGFRKNHSVMNNLLQLFFTLEINREKGLYTQIILLDVDCAFNHVNINKLKDIMLDYRFPHSMVNWVMNFFQDKIYICAGNSIKNSNGLDQGSTLSPTLFNIYMTKVGKKLKYSKIMTFADDIILMCEDNNPYNLKFKLQDDFNTILSELQGLELTINSNKTKTMIFGEKLNQNNLNYFQIQCGTEKIQVARSHKYLGMQIDSDLKWNGHYQYVTARCQSDLNALKMMKTKNWGNHPTTQRTLYNNVTFPKIGYGLSIYSWRHIDKLQITQNKFLNQILGTLKTTSISALHCMTGLPYIKTRIYHNTKKCIAHFYTKFPELRTLIDEYSQLSLNKNKQLKELQQLIKETVEEVEVKNIHLYEPEETNYRLELTKLPIEIKTSVPNIDKKADKSQIYLHTVTMEFIESTYQGEWVHIYTDGSKNNFGTASAFYCKTHKSGMGSKLENFCDIFFAETNALKMALEHINEHHKDENVLILTDAKSVLAQLDNLKYAQFLDIDLQRIINQFQIRQDTSQKETALQWIPSHIGIKGNETVDKLARLTTEHGRIVNNRALPTRQYLHLLHDGYIRYWKNQHHKISIGKGKWTNSIIKDPTTKPWFSNTTMDVNKITTLNRILSGHGYTNSFKYLIKKNETPKCDICRTDDYQTIQHLIEGCTGTESMRRTLYSYYPTFKNQPLKDLIAELINKNDLLLLANCFMELNINI
jgi:exonuclease III/ribonuclease HI